MLIFFIVLHFFTLTLLISGKNVPSEVAGSQMRPIIDEDPDFASLQSRAHNKWPMGNVPYYFNVSSYDQHAAKRIRMVMNKLESSCCIRFTPIIVLPESNSDITYLAITNPKSVRECVHYTTGARSTGQIPLILGYDCLDKRNIMHTLLHGLGFQDEITHSSRDQYVRVLWDNIQPKYQHLFRVSDRQNVGEYDPLSIMHFHERAYSHNGQATIEPLTAGLLINPSKELSHLDLMKLRVLFGRECNKRKVAELLDTCKDVLATSNKDVMDDSVESSLDDEIDSNAKKYGNEVNTQEDENGASSLEDGDGSSKTKDGDGPISSEDGDGGSKVKDGNGQSSLEDGDDASSIKDGSDSSTLEEGDGVDTIKDGNDSSSLEDGDGADIIKEGKRPSSLEDGDGASTIKDGSNSSTLKDGDGAITIKDGNGPSSLEEGNEVDPLEDVKGASSL